MEERTVSVRRQPQDHRIAGYRLEDVYDPHLSSVTGGVQRSTGHPRLFAYVICDAMLDGELAHSCQHGTGPHRIKVCITKVGNDRATWRELAAMADEKQARHLADARARNARGA